MVGFSKGSVERERTRLFDTQELDPVDAPERPDEEVGVSDGALNFEAEKEHYLQVAESSDFNFTGPFTVMAWVKPTRRNAAFAIACMKGDKSGDPPWPGWRLRFFWARAMLQVGTPDGLEPSVSSEEWSVPVGYWTHVAASWDGEQLRIFTNAVERAATEFSGEIAPQPRPLIIGNYIGRKNAYGLTGVNGKSPLPRTASSTAHITANTVSSCQGRATT